LRKKIIMVYADFGRLGADKQSTYELLLEHRGRQFTVTAIMIPAYLNEPRGAWYALWRWRRMTSRRPATWQLYQGQEARMALRNLFAAAGAANLPKHGQRFCYVLPSVPAQPGALEPLIPAQLRADGSLPMHPQLWQVGQSLDTLPIERHDQVCTDRYSIVKLTTSGRSLDEGCLR
jgi:hypothetical protein